MHSSVIVVAPCELTIKNDCRVVDIVSWRRGQSYCWRFMNLRLLMWLIQIDEKGSLTLAKSRALVAINRCCRHCNLLRRDIGHDHCVNDVLILQLLLTLAMQRKVWLVLAWHVRLCCNQPSFVVGTPCNAT
jgi:hypothetical protein